MAFTFPSSPTVDQVYQNYRWDGEKWVASSTSISEAPSDNTLYGRKDMLWVAAGAFKSFTGDYNADNTGVADCSAAFVAAATAGGTVLIPKGTYLLSSQTNIDTRVTFLLEDDVTIDITHSGVGFMVNASYVQFIALGRCVIDGPKTSLSDFNSTSYAFYINGTLAAPIHGFTLLGPGLLIANFSFEAIRGWFCYNGLISEIEIDNCGHAGVLLLSAYQFNIYRCRISNITPGVGGSVPRLNAYGVAYTRDLSQSLALAPASTHCFCNDNFLLNIQTYSGLDTHGGQYITFERNQVLNTCQGITVTHANGGGNSNPPKAVSVRDNYVENVVPPSFVDTCVTLTGSSGAGMGSGDVAEDCVVEGNILVGGGTNTGPGGSPSNNSAALIVQNTWNARIRGNTFKNCRYIGISLSYRNWNYQISGNMFQDIGTVDGKNTAILYGYAELFGLTSANTFWNSSGTMVAHDIVAQTAGFIVNIDRSNVYWSLTSTYTVGSQANRVDPGATAS